MESIVVGIVTGIATSVIWAIVLVIARWWRNSSIETSIRKSIDSNSYVDSIDGVGITIRNSTGFDFIIRKTKIWTAKGDFGVQLSFFDPHCESHCTLENGDWVRMPPETESLWLVHPRKENRGSVVAMGEQKPDDVTITVAYQTLFGSIRVVDIKLIVDPPHAPDFVFHLFEKHGWMDNVRRLVGAKCPDSKDGRYGWRMIATIDLHPFKPRDSDDLKDYLSKSKI